jgi:hypothetical protein
MTYALYGSQWEKHALLIVYETSDLLHATGFVTLLHHCLKKQMMKLSVLPIYIVHVFSLNLEQETGSPVEGFYFLPAFLLA